MSLQAAASNEVLTVRVPERGHVDIPASEFAVLSQDQALFDLVERGLIQVSFPASGLARLHGTSYVGRTMVAEHRIELVEKVDGALRAILRFASWGDLGVSPMPGPSGELGDLFALLAREFLGAVETYVTRGRRFTYSRVADIGSRLEGSLDVARTVRRWASGKRHQVAFTRTEVSRLLPYHEVVLAALRELEDLGPRVGLSVADIARTRAAAMLFRDSVTRDVLMRDRHHFLDRADRLDMRGRPEHEKDLLAMTRVVLAHESFGGIDEDAGVVPRSWFVNLETLFETAVRRSLGSALGQGGEVAKGASFGMRIYESDYGRFTADPDLVVTLEGRRPVVGDVKYKVWTGAASRPDLYQLLVHGAAFGAGVTFLVYPGDTSQVKRIGAAVTGSETWLCTIDLFDFMSGIEGLAEAIRESLNSVGE